MSRIPINTHATPVGEDGDTPQPSYGMDIFKIGSI